MSVSDPFSVPENAILAFEELAGVRVTVHDWEGTLYPFLRPERFLHASPHCQAVKAANFYMDCIRFDMDRVRREILNFPDGRVQMCHAGLVECVVPVLGEKGLRWTFFAGVMQPAGDLELDGVDPQQTGARTVWIKRGLNAQTVKNDRAMRILEGLRQLAARLRCWLIDAEQGIGANLPADRWRVIQWFVAHRYTQSARVEELAELMGVTETRCRHLVREVTGKGFLELLTNARISAAAVLLKNTDLSIIGVAERSGWADLSRFYRVFRREMGVTPHQYRKQRAAQPFTPVTLGRPKSARRLKTED